MHHDHDRMIDLSQLTRHQAERMAQAMRRPDADVPRQASAAQHVKLARAVFALIYTLSVLWAVWGIGRIAYWW